MHNLFKILLYKMKNLLIVFANALLMGSCNSSVSNSNSLGASDTTHIVGNDADANGCKGSILGRLLKMSALDHGKIPFNYYLLIMKILRQSLLHQLYLALIAQKPNYLWPMKQKIWFWIKQKMVMR